MKKMILSISLGLAFMLTFTGIVQAETYSKSHTIPMSAGGANYNVSETANYETSGNTRWSFSNRKYSYTGGTMYPISSNLSASTTEQNSSGTTYYTVRSYKLRTTNQSYKDFYSTKTSKWTFDTRNNSLN